jgi:putative addiction module antidote
MITSLKLTKIGTSTGAVLPKEMLARMKVAKGDTLYAIETAEGYLITPYDPAIEDQLEAGREFMKDYRDTFKALAKCVLTLAGSARKHCSCSMRKASPISGVRVDSGTKVFWSLSTPVEYSPVSAG